MDLSHTDAQNFHPRFPERTCTSSELNYLNRWPLGSPEYVERLWMIWSIKESAYKACKQYNPDMSGWWNAFEVMPDKGKVLCHGDFFLKVKTEKGYGGKEGNIPYIHTLAYSPFLTLDQIKSDVTCRDANMDQSKAVRDFTVRKLFGPDKMLWHERISWCKEKSGAPVLKISHETLKGRLSLSHHGCFVAFATNYDVREKTCD
ncbi:MAG: hypothetical protein PWP06_682 [Candidatus Marinimicrobia bacterium]|nr:hypothetical protein [Candidatus Neomarinimicrobiota bacterium]